MNPATCTPEEHRRLVNERRILHITATDNMAAHRFFGMGFALGPVRFYSLEFAMQQYLVPFRCVCGREEVLSAILEREEEWERENVFLRIHGFGAMSRDHLLNDGYTPEQIDDMHARFREYMVGAGFTPYERAYAYQDHSRRPYFSEGSSAWVYREDRVPPVPGLDQDFALQVLRTGVYARLPERPVTYQLVQGRGDKEPRLVRDPTVPRVPRPLRAGGGKLDHG